VQPPMGERGLPFILQELRLEQSKGQKNLFPPFPMGRKKRPVGGRRSGRLAGHTKFVPDNISLILLNNQQ
jgi:hypothetical protein